METGALLVNFHRYNKVPEAGLLYKEERLPWPTVSEGQDLNNIVPTLARILWTTSHHCDQHGRSRCTREKNVVRQEARELQGFHENCVNLNGGHTPSYPSKPHLLKGPPPWGPAHDPMGDKPHPSHGKDLLPGSKLLQGIFSVASKTVPLKV